MKSAYVYVLRCQNPGRKGIFYIGQTSRTVEERVLEHKVGKSKFTRNFVQKVLVLTIELGDPSVRRGVENWLKDHRRTVYAMLAGDWNRQRVTNFFDWLTSIGLGHITVNTKTGVMVAIPGLKSWVIV